MSRVIVVEVQISHVLYECGICSCYHPWAWGGDCREDENRYPTPEDYEERFHLQIGSAEVRPWEDRVSADR